MKRLSTLYKKTSTGQIEQWSIWTDGSVIFTEHGHVGGKLQQNKDVITSGKNIGRSNETTPRQQAESEAFSRWKKKVERNGYVEDIKRATNGETDQAGGIAPMLACVHEDHKEKLKYPCLFQRKYNGIRCIAVYENGITTLWTRKREQIIIPVPHIIDAINKHFRKINSKIILDGELFIPGLSLQQIGTYVRQKKEPKPGYNKVGYYIYDLPSSNKTNIDRYYELDVVLKGCAHPLVFVPTYQVNSEEIAWNLTDKWIKEEGMEGGIGRNRNGFYEAGKRSHNLHKFKRFQDKEFKIVGTKYGRGKFANILIAICLAENGKTFECNLPGDLDKRQEYHPEDIINQWLTIKFHGRSDDGIPTNLSGVAIRDYE